MSTSAVVGEKVSTMASTCDGWMVLLGAAGLSANEDHGGAATPIQHFGSAANLNIHLHCLVLGGVDRRGADGVPDFIEAGAPTD